MLNREEIKRAMRGPIATVNVPEWAGDVCIRRMSAADLIRLREQFHNEPSDDEAADNAARNMDYVCAFLSMVLCDENGETIFTSEELHEWDGQQSDVLNRLVEDAQKHNGLDKQAAENLEKKSEGGQTSGST